MHVHAYFTLFCIFVDYFCLLSHVQNVQVIDSCHEGVVSAMPTPGSSDTKVSSGKRYESELSSLASMSKRNRCLVRFSVEDTGIGIPRERLPHIFDAFEQASPSTQLQFGGTGLGLTICSRLVELMGGKLQVESELGSGTQFLFDIILDSCCVSQDEFKEKFSSGENSFQLNPSFELNFGRPQRIPVGLDSFRILVVDDVELNRRVLQRHLQKYLPKECIFETSNVKTSCEILEHARFHCILLDYLLGSETGLDVLSSVRASSLTMPNTDVSIRTKVILCTADVQESTRDLAFSMGVDAILYKPIRPASLDSLLRFFFEI